MRKSATPNARDVLPAQGQELANRRCNEGGLARPNDASPLKQLLDAQASRGHRQPAA